MDELRHVAAAPASGADRPRVYDAAAADFADRFAAFLAERRDPQTDLGETVRAIIAAVRDRGDSAVFEYTERFDRLALTAETVKLDAETIDRAVAEVPAAIVDALRLAAARIEAFHQAQPVGAQWWQDDAGVGLGARWTPIEAVGLYVPGGRAAYPSSVLMNAVPAKVAGVEQLVMVVPTPDGVLNGAVLAAARIAGVDNIYRVGGAQAVAALAYGTETIPAVDKVVGPGNAYVTEAKRQVFGQVGIDMMAGPSEILVVADDGANPRWVAADLLSQAEHDEVAQAILITDSPAFADAVVAAAADHLAVLPRAETAVSWRNHGAVFVVSSLDQVPALVDRIAPEHLELAVRHPERLLDRIRNAGSIFIGDHTPEAIGDYVGGPNHVLPNERRARFSSGLNVLDFMKRTTLLRCSPEGLAAIGPAAVTLADAEGLSAHALSVSLRLDHPLGPRR